MDLESLKEVKYLGWIDMLSRTYDACSSLAGQEIGDDPVLLPIAHSTANAQIELTVDMEGNFIGELTEVVEKNGRYEITIIPVTEDSAARTNGNFPHPLCDKLCYVAGDYSRYTGEDYEEFFESYLDLLGKWAGAETTHRWVQAVYRYVRKGHMIEDLLSVGILKTNEHGLLSEKENKIQNLPQIGAFVRFAVWENGKKEKLWKIQEVYDSYTNYYLQSLGQRTLCYVSGQEDNCTEKHPSKIRNSADKAKLISGNDDSGFTYRGRFEDKNEAVCVGYEISQKAHSALRWLIRKQGYTRDESTIVVWRLPGMEQTMDAGELTVPDIFSDTANAFPVDWDEVFSVSEQESEKTKDMDTGARYAHLINQAMDGYRGKFRVDDRVIMMAVDAATPGRLSITYYHEFAGNRFIESVIDWHTSCHWRRNVKLRNEEKRIWVDGAPSPREMALAAFGTERGNGYLDCDAKLVKGTVQRILPCIVGLAQKIPSDIVRAAANRASNPQAYSPFVWENQVLAVTCAMLQYNQIKTGKKEDKMDTERERAILFGKLLAVVDEMERKALYGTDTADNRMTNAKKLWSVYTRRPAATYERLYSKMVQAYFGKLYAGTRTFLETEAEVIVNRLREIQGFNNRPLKEDYLLGYCEERSKIMNRSKKADEDSTESEGGNE